MTDGGPSMHLGFIDSLSDAVLIVDPDGSIERMNEAAALLGFSCGDRAPDESATTADRSPVVIDHHMLGDRTMLIVREDADSVTSAEMIAARFADGIRAGEAPDQAAAAAIRAGLGWRWTAVCRTVDDERFEIMTWLEDDEAEGPMFEEIAGTACEMVLDADEMVVFKDLDTDFGDEEYVEMGARVYAGLVYKVDGEPVGHIFAMHDDDEAEVAKADTVLTVASQLLGSHLELLRARDAVASAEQAAHTDALTGAGNRRAFDRLLDGLDPDPEHVVAMIDLDGLKIVNDSFGHDAGDRLLRDFGRKLSAGARDTDSVFRIGGDEFVVVLRSADGRLLSGLKGRVETLITELRESGVRNFGASVGVAHLGETDGDVRAWVALADQRMYTQKREKQHSVLADLDERRRRIS